jgi:hypothetical protein
MRSAEHSESRAARAPAIGSGRGALGWLRARTPDQQLFALVLTALAVQIFVQYWGQRSVSLTFAGVVSAASGERAVWSFYYATAVARVALPWLCVWLLLGPSLRELGLAQPRVGARELLWLGAALAVGTAMALLVLGSASYQDAYRGSRQAAFWPAFVRFGMFTLSATVPWELLHRGFLLHGLHAILLRSGAPAPRATTLAILVTTCFETLFHLVKPPHEAIGMLIGSPLLSWIALRHQSLWIPALAHLWIEALFFAMILV